MYLWVVLNTATGKLTPVLSAEPTAESGFPGDTEMGDRISVHKFWCSLFSQWQFQAGKDQDSRGGINLRPYLLYLIKNMIQCDSLMVKVFRLCIPMRGVRVQSLVGELRFVAKKPNYKLQKQYCNQFIKDFRTNTHQKKILKTNMIQAGETETTLSAEIHEEFL